MSAGLPESVDAWRMLAAHRCFEGLVPLTAMPRLCEALEQPEGECRFELAFDRGMLDVPYIGIRVTAQLPLVCQRSLRRFLLPVTIDQKLAMLKSESQEDALPEGYESIVVAADGIVHPLELIEDELILALPVVAVDPDSDEVALSWPPQDDVHEDDTPRNPFAVLAGIRNDKSN